MNEESKEILKLLIFLPCALIGALIFAYSVIKQDPALTDHHQRSGVYEKFEKELKEIETPPSTAENTTKKLGGSGKAIVVYRIYRSELPENEVFGFFDKALQKRGWKVFSKNEREKKFIYCQGKLQADLEPSFSRFGDKGIYLSLTFKLDNLNSCRE